MAKDIFQRDTSRLGGVFTADRAKLTFGEGVNLGTLVQQLQITYAQTITRLYELGASDDGGTNGPASSIYYVGGRTQGNLNLARVVGPSATIVEMYEEYGDVCTPDTIQITLEETNCYAEGGTNPATNSKKYTYAAKNAVIQQVGLSVAAQDMIINENTQMMFSSLTIKGR